MRYSSNPALQEVYELLARLYDDHRVAANARLAMVIANALVECGEDRSWASVWWAYAAIYHEPTDEAYARALELLERVAQPTEARAAALMLAAQIRFTQSLYQERDADYREQLRLLTEAVSLAPGWPDLYTRVARAAVAVRDSDLANVNIAAARHSLSASVPSGDPFEVLISGIGLDHDGIRAELDRVEVEVEGVNVESQPEPGGGTAA